MASTFRSQLVAGSPRRPALIRPDGSEEEIPFYAEFERGTRVLDVGCGPGFHLRQLRARGCDAVGLELSSGVVRQLRDEGLVAVVGAAERLPFPAESFDGLICCVVIPYTDERQAIAEWARVLKAGGRVRASYHGLGCALEDMFQPGHHWKKRFYGSRQLANTCYYQLLGRRLPGLLGDALCQTPSRLRKYYRHSGLELVAEYLHPGMADFPRFVYHDLRKGKGP